MDGEQDVNSSPPKSVLRDGARKKGVPASAQGLRRLATKWSTQPYVKARCLTTRSIYINIDFTIQNFRPNYSSMSTSSQPEFNEMGRNLRSGIGP